MPLRKGATPLACWCSSVPAGLGRMGHLMTNLFPFNTTMDNMGLLRPYMSVGIDLTGMTGKKQQTHKQESWDQEGHVL